MTLPLIVEMLAPRSSADLGTFTVTCVHADCVHADCVHADCVLTPRSSADLGCMSHRLYES